MANETPRSFFDRTIQVKVWKVLVALIIAPLLVFWMMVVHQEDEIMALSRNEVITDSTGNRTWYGAFYNTDDMVYRDVATTVNFLDASGEVVAQAMGAATELPPGQQLALQATLPEEAVNLRIYSVQWRNDRTSAMMGPFREPWEFGYLMFDPDKVN